MKKVSLLRLLTAGLCTTVSLLLGGGVQAQQMADPNFQAVVARPAYSETHPVVVIDEAHANFHTATGRYQPLADVLRNDGYQVLPGTKKFVKGSLEGVRVLVISNAAVPEATDEASAPAFTEEECTVVRDWVRAGGSLLLIADHTPFGSAAEALGKQFGVEMGKGFVFDLENSETGAGPTTLVFSRANGLLGAHPLLQGRDATEEVKRVVAFTGQSLGVPDSAVVLMKLGPTAYESPSRQELRAALEAVLSGAASEATATLAPHARQVGGRAQGLALTFGEGRVVVLGEAALFSAQVIRFTEEGQPREFKMGMNVPGNDDRQFALNVLHWLSGLLN